LLERSGNNLLHSLPNFSGIMFNPSGLRQYLAMFHLMLSNNLARMIKNHKSSTAGSLIQAADVSHDAQNLSL
jgi:hypothetical protein